MRGAVLHAPGDVRLEQRDDPKIIESTDAIIRLSATCICGSDLWPYRGIEAVDGPAPMGHEYAGVVEEVGRDVRTIQPGQFVVGSFFTSDNTCEICRAGYQSSCIHRTLMGTIGTQAEYARIPLADGTLVATPEVPSHDLVPHCLAASGTQTASQLGAERRAVLLPRPARHGLRPHAAPRRRQPRAIAPWTSAMPSRRFSRSEATHAARARRDAHVRPKTATSPPTQRPVARASSVRRLRVPVLAKIDLR